MLSYDISEKSLNGLLPEHFGEYSHRIIFSAIRAVMSKSSAITMIGVAEKLRERGMLATAGGEDYLALLIDQQAVPLSTVPEAAEIIQKQHRLRMIAQTAETAIRAVSGADADLAYAENQAREMLRLLETRKLQKEPTTTALAGITEHAAETFRPSVKTGWECLDRIVKLSPGRLIVLGARPGMGKTTLATQLATQVLCLDEKAHVLYCSVEMDAAEIGCKALSKLTGTDCVSAFESADDEGIKAIYSRAGQFSPVLHRMRILFNTRMDKLCNVANNMQDAMGVDLVVVDFISSMQPSGIFGTKTEAIGAVSKGLKALAKQLQIPVLACSQLNRGTNASKRPSMKDLRDSGEIEQDADVVLLMHRNPELDDINTDLIVEKNRFGTLADMTIYPELHYHRFLPAQLKPNT